MLFGFVGDVLVNRDDPAQPFSKVRDVLDKADILFGNLEGAFTDTPILAPGVVQGTCVPARMLDVFPQVGFDVMSLANNHVLDAGYVPMLDARDRLRKAGVQTCGAGEDLAAARKPAILESEGLRVAFLAYASVFPVGHEARRDAPGVAPMRAYNFWRDQYPRLYTPGHQPLVTTVPDEVDLANLERDIRSARERADIVVASFHWGDYSRPFHLTDHETRIARHSIDLGADIVVGHHHHALRGMEWYKDRPIMYGLGHFVFDLVVELTADGWNALLSDLRLDPETYLKSQYATTPREGWPYLPMHEDTRMTLMACVELDGRQVRGLSFLPCKLGPDGVVLPVQAHSAEHAEVLEYVRKCNESQGLNGSLVSGGGGTIAGHAMVEVISR